MTDRDANPAFKRWIPVAALVLAAGAVAMVVLRAPAARESETTTPRTPDPAQGADHGGAVGEDRGGGRGSPPVGRAPDEGAPPPEGRAAAPGAAGSGPGEITSAAPLDMTQLLLEAKTVDAARTALAAGDPKKALRELEFYDTIPNRRSLRQEATLLKIEALSLVGRRSEALALAYSTRDDPSFEPYRKRVDALVNDAGR